jgi:hypothetical protein
MVDAQRASRFGGAALDYVTAQERARRRPLLSATADTLAAADARDQARQRVASASDARERDVLAALAEAGLSDRAARAVAAAAARGLVSANPGVLLPRALAAAAALEQQQQQQQTPASSSPLLLPRGSVSDTLLAACPSLLNHAPQTLALHLEALAGVFADDAALAAAHAAANAAATAALRCPRLLTCPPFRVWAAMEALAEALMPQELGGGAGTAAAAAIAARAAAARHPRLLTLSPRALARRAAALRALLPPSTRPSSPLRRCPALLLYRPDALERKLSALASAAFGGDAAAAAAAAARHPQLLTLDAEKVGKRAAALRAALEGGGGGLQSTAAAAARLQPSLLAAAEGSAERRLAALASAVRASGLLLLLREEEQQQERAAADYARRMAAGAPALLTLSEATVARRVRRLAELARRGGRAVVVVPAPSAPAQPRSAARACWVAQLASLSPASVGVMLCLSDRRLERLDAVARAYGGGEEDKEGGAPSPLPPLRAVVLASDSAFEARWTEAAAAMVEANKDDQGVVMTCR